MGYISWNWIITGYNYALSSTANASQNNTAKTASNAIDNNLNTYSVATNNYTVGNYWWKVDVGERIIFTNASIYVRNGKCGSTGALFDCCKYHYLTSKLSFLKLNFDDDSTAASCIFCNLHAYK